jgi:hypothetical protein
MGKQLVINGEEVELSQGQPTGGDIKAQLQRPPTDTVIYAKDDGVHQVRDDEAIPDDVERVSVVPTFEYGGRGSHGRNRHGSAK